MKFIVGALVLASIISLLCISLIPRDLTREGVAKELERKLTGETVIETNLSQAAWDNSKSGDPDGYDAFGATVSRSGKEVRIYFDQKKLRFQKHPITAEGDPPKS